MPAVGIYGVTRTAEGVGGGDNTVLAWSEPANPNAELLTANNVTPYLLSQTDLSKGPVVVEVPAATDKASLYGQIIDHWQLTIADVGPSGVDKGKGGKILLTPPGYAKQIPAGYIEVKSPSYRVNFVFRSIKSATATTADAYAYSKTLKMYYLDNPKETQFIDPSDKQFASLPRYDESWFDDVSAIFSLENAKEQRPGLSSAIDGKTMQKNKDGSTTLYFGPKAPKGHESNWIPTAGKKPVPVLRVYGGTEKFWDKSWTMPDVELVK
jgi:hypothetical protein